jgi:hypothetical protein
MFGASFSAPYCLRVFNTSEGFQMLTEIKERRPPLDTDSAAVYTGTKPNYLEKLRCNGDGPVFIKRNGLVRYDPIDLDAWLEAGKRHSTSNCPREKNA